MIKVEDLEKQDKLRSQKKTKLENQKISQDIKPKKPTKMPKLRSRPMPAERPEAPEKKYTEYRSLITPLLGGLTWMTYKQMLAAPSEDEYNQIMTSIVASPDINALIQDQLTYFDSSGGLIKALATCAAKIVEASTVKVLNQQASTRLRLLLFYLRCDLRRN